MRKKFEQFVTAVAFLLILPLFPLLAEFIKTHDLKSDTLTLSLAFYCFCLAASTNYLLVFTFCFMAGIVESFKYDGRSVQSAFPIYSTIDFYIFLAVFVLHSIERFFGTIVNLKYFFILYNLITMTYYLSIFELVFGVFCIFYVLYRNRDYMFPSKRKQKDQVSGQSSDPSSSTKSGRHPRSDNY